MPTFNAAQAMSESLDVGLHTTSMIDETEQLRQTLALVLRSVVHPKQPAASANLRAQVGPLTTDGRLPAGEVHRLAAPFKVLHHVLLQSVVGAHSSVHQTKLQKRPLSVPPSPLWLASWMGKSLHI
jgi:hypothetical protein